MLSADEVEATGRSIAAMQEPDGAIPWTTGEHVDVWNHVEAAMALLVAGQVAAAEAAYDWCLELQRADGSWPMKIVRGEVEDDSGETNMSAYLAVGVWHHWLVRRDRSFVERCWPAVRAGLDYVCSMQLPWGGIAWSREWTDGAPGEASDEAMLAGSSSIHHSLRAGLALAALLDAPAPRWEEAAGRLGHAVREHPDAFADKSTYSMDWYYPVLAGVVRGAEGAALLATRWDDFVVPGLGVRCVDTNPWVTGAETAELVMALDALGERDRACRVLGDSQHLRLEDGRYWTGFVFPDEGNWPPEQTTYTAAAQVLAVDALSRSTPGAGIMRGDSLPAVRELEGDCRCRLSA
ncbi:prenyltransferase [Marmoricola endophyticus]|uniref:Prenyltransferase n=1 Tax=Marmoricola endophyticus TaxID=2040280 RepID=A0A917F0P6_9ACTN|nr:prenyltransferase [Marmoricola endophyticus]